MTIHRPLGLALSLATAASLAFAQAPVGPPAPPLSPQQRTEVLQALSTQLSANYVFPDVAAGIVAALPGKVQAYAASASATELSGLLSKNLRALGNDKHFRVFYDPRFRADAAPDAVPSAQDMERQRAEVASLGFGIEKLQRLPGNVAVLELRGFGPAELLGAAYAAAVTLLDGSDALILDLRRNGGGSPDSVALVGQTTGGGANAGDRFSLGHGMVVNIPTARAINPVTHTNWEHVGVKPDIEAPAARAQQVAYVAILRTLSGQAADPEQAQHLRKWLALAEKGESEAPVFEMRQ